MWLALTCVLIFFRRNLQNWGFLLQRVKLISSFCGFLFRRDVTWKSSLPVRICRAQLDAHIKHVDADFCFPLPKNMNFLATILVFVGVIFISPVKSYSQTWFDCSKVANRYGHAHELSNQAVSKHQSSGKGVDTEGDLDS